MAATIEYIPWYWTATGTRCKTRREAEEQLKELKKRFAGWILPPDAKGGVDEVDVCRIGSRPENNA